MPTYEAFTAILATTKEQVDWAYEVWDELVDWLTDAIIVDPCRSVSCWIWN